MSKQRFKLKVYGKIYKNCFFHLSEYINGSMQISVFGTNPETKQLEHFLDITLDQNSVDLGKNEIVIDNYFKNELLEQLEKMRILEEKVGTCVVECITYPIYKLNFETLKQYTYETHEISA